MVIQEIVVTIFYISWGMQVLLLFLFNITFLFIPRKYNRNQPFVTVLIPVYNQAALLKRNISAILHQNYENFKVLVVNDGSYQSEKELFNTLETLDDRLECLHLSDNVGKKCAVSHALDQISDSLILATDADCVPRNENWIRSMVRHYSSGSCVVGYGPYQKKNGSLNKWIRYETATTAIQYMSLAQLGSPYMAVGRNFLYEHSAFKKAGGFSRHKHILSGDDDLFVRDLHRNGINVVPNKDPESYVDSIPAGDLSSYWQQKERHGSTASSYSLFHQVLLMLIPLSLIALYLSAIYLIIAHFAYIIPAMLILYWILHVLLKSYSFSILQEKDLIKRIPFLDIFAILYYIRLIPGILGFRKNKW